MASLRRFPRSPFWFACFSSPDGRRVQRSTKETTRKAAQAKADEWEQFASDRAKARQAHRVIADIYREAHKAELPDSTPREFINGWLARRRNEIAPASFASYNARGLDFIKWIGESADRPIAELETRVFIAYRDAIATTRSATTANHGIKVLRAIFEDARRDGFIGDNPARDCGLLKKTTSGAARRPFTMPELSRVLGAADDEWRSLVLFGLYTGQRLGDLARLSWTNVDVQANEICIKTRKTGRLVRIPIATPLATHIATLNAGDEPKAAIHPRAAAHAAKSSSTLSRQFAELLASVGMADERSHEAEKEGRSARRAQSALTFHCLRHTATSLMKNAGVSPAIVQDIIGHESAEISAHYTHVESEAKRQALATLPDLSAITPTKRTK